jgi:hypothetical protein
VNAARLAAELASNRVTPHRAERVVEEAAELFNAAKRHTAQPFGADFMLATHRLAGRCEAMATLTGRTTEEVMAAVEALAARL